VVKLSELLDRLDYERIVARQERMKAIQRAEDCEEFEQRIDSLLLDIKHMLNAKGDKP
jgi:hypothetical protein